MDSNMKSNYNNTHEYVIRIASKNDIKRLSKLHINASNVQPNGFLHELGEKFLETYYKIHLQSKFSLILVSEDLHGVIQGFCSGTLSVPNMHNELRRCRWKLGYSLFRAIISKPSLIGSLITRYKFIQGSKGTEYSTSDGVRLEYWCWNIYQKQPIQALRILRVWLDIAKSLGHLNINTEVDQGNESVKKLHVKMGAVIIKTVELDDKRKRFFLRYKFN